jgi:5,5'-dehydrodivanillate O-demethylase
MGELLRRYWHPVAATATLDAEPVLPVKLLGENLALYRSPTGELGLIAERCPHRGASMVYGIPEEGGLRCPYHGWKFSGSGACMEQPAEPPDSTFRHRVRIPAYPVQELGGLIWAYLGPAPVPILPRYDMFTWDNVIREIGATTLSCNWLQIMENSVDPVHAEWLHGRYSDYVNGRIGGPAAGFTKRHRKIGFDVFDYGIIKRRLIESESDDSDDWQIGHPLIFPNMVRFGAGGHYTLEIRVPLDDTHTWQLWYTVYRPRIEVEPQVSVPMYDVPIYGDDGRFVTDFGRGQDAMAWATQGEVIPRNLEHLGVSDTGVILYRRLLQQQMERMTRGEDPMNVHRGGQVDEVIDLPGESGEAFFGGARNAARSFYQSRNSPVVDYARMIFSKAAAQADEGKPLLPEILPPAAVISDTYNVTLRD